MAVKRLSSGILVAIEGIDGAGKTTQASLLQERLTGAGFDVVRTKEPTNGPHGQRLRESAATGRMSATEELATFIEDRRQHVSELIEPSLRDGKIVIIDRYFLSTAAYQGARGLDPEGILRVNESFAPIPDRVFVLQISAAVAMERIAQRGDVGENHFEKHEALERSAEIFATINRPYLVRIDGTLGREEIHREITRELDLGPIFKRLCMKGYLEECEPEQCSFREQCGYPGLDLCRPRSAISLGQVNEIVDAGGDPADVAERVLDLLKRS
jgi:dTMP kinase